MPTYSHSRLSTFEDCPRRYYYRYIARLVVEEEEGIEGFLGSLVHEALEKLYRDRMFGRVLTAHRCRPLCPGIPLPPGRWIRYSGRS